MDCLWVSLFSCQVSNQTKSNQTKSSTHIHTSLTSLISSIIVHSCPSLYTLLFCLLIFLPFVLLWFYRVSFGVKSSSLFFFILFCNLTKYHIIDNEEETCCSSCFYYCYCCGMCYDNSSWMVLCVVMTSRHVQ